VKAPAEESGDAWKLQKDRYKSPRIPARDEGNLKEKKKNKKTTEILISRKKLVQVEP